MNNLRLIHSYYEKHSSKYFRLPANFIAAVLLSVFFCNSLTAEDYILPETLIDSVNLSSTAYFDFGKSDLRQDALAQLDEVAGKLIGNPGYTIQISGHTDDVGSDDFNMALSQNRAETVKEYLVSKGVDPGRITTFAKGKSEPLNDNTSEESRTKNRRVEFTLVIPERKEIKSDEEFVNSSFKPVSRNEISGDFSARDSSGSPIEDVKEEDISAVLKWKVDEKDDSTAGSPRVIPIDDKKKIAFTLTMDYSGSMYGTDYPVKNTPKSEKIIAMEEAVKTFVKELQSNMFCKIIKFGDNVEEMSRFTKSKEILYKSIDNKSYYRGGTALYSSIYTAFGDTTYQSNPTVMKTVIAFTDGMENSSKKITLDSIYNKSGRLNTKVFTVGLLGDLGSYTPTEYEKVKGSRDLFSIAKNTGGFFYNAGVPSELTGIYRNIFAQILKSYQVSIIWNSDNLPPKGTKVKAVIRVNVKGNLRTLYKDYIME